MSLCGLAGVALLHLCHPPMIDGLAGDEGDAREHIQVHRHVPSPLVHSSAKTSSMTKLRVKEWGNIENYRVIRQQSGV